MYPETQKRALAIGFTDFLIKPFQQEDLVELLGKHLQVEWIYKEAEEEEVRKEPSEPTHEPLVFPPPSETAVLLEFARIGFAKEMYAELSKIEQQDEKFLPFVNHMRQLIREYRFVQIVELLETQE